MTDAFIMVAVVAGIAVLVALVVWLRRRPRRMKTRRFQEKWRDLQKLCANKDMWGEAIIEADKLLGEALKKKRFAGKSVGERLMAAQRMLTDNEAVWFGHKLRNKLLEEPTTRLKEKEVKEALIGFRQALKDLGALPTVKAEQAVPEPAVKKAAPTKVKPAPKAAKAPAKTKAAPKAKPAIPAKATPKPAAPAKRPVRRKVVQ